ncbi:MAG: hypothetical protein JWL90_946 [Chthoniobacteraceae bacterium]|nr:hypothetical protein [Chthoniobacteraceae bacterium]
MISAALIAAMTLSSCETPGQSALAGAATGAAVGGLLHGRGSDALAGAAIGAGAGYLLGKVAQVSREERGYDGYSEGRSRYPFGQPTRRYGFVESPYRPYHIIDVRGIPSGAKVVDPSSDRIFINP